MSKKNYLIILQHSRYFHFYFLYHRMLSFLSLWPKCPINHPRREDLAVERKWWDMWLHNLSSQEAESPGWNGSQPVTLRSPAQRLITFGCASTPKDAAIPQHSTTCWGPSVHAQEPVGGNTAFLLWRNPWILVLVWRRHGFTPRRHTVLSPMFLLWMQMT